MAATQSDMDDEFDFFSDEELINDLGIRQTESLSVNTENITLVDIHHDLVLCIQLLGVIVALLIISYAMAVLDFFIKLITKNITNQM